jgi:hypothetical protein
VRRDNRQQQTGVPSPPTPTRETRNRLIPPPTRPRHAPLAQLIAPRPTCVSPRRLDKSHPAGLTYLIPAYRSAWPPDLPTAAPPDATPASRLGSPVQVLPGLSRKGVRREAADPLPPSARAARPGNTGRRGGGLLRSGKKPIERNRWRETQGGKQHCRLARRSQPRQQPLGHDGARAAPGKALMATREGLNAGETSQTSVRPRRPAWGRSEPDS